MTNRFFKTSKSIYDATRQALDAAFGNPNGKADTCLDPAPFMDQDGAVFTAVPDFMTQWPEVAPVLSGLLSAGSVTEITEEDYEAALPQGQII